MSLTSTIDPIGAQQAAYRAEQARKTPQTAGGLAPQSGRTFAADGSYTDYGVGLDQELGIRDKYNAAADARMAGTMSSFSAGGGTGAPTVSRDTGDIATREAAGRNAAFARAKEQSAATAQASLKGLRNNLSSRGITGGGYAQMRGAEALAPAADRLQDFTREQLIQDVGNLQHTGDLDYQGQVQQRGQTLNNQQSLMGLMKSSRLY